jgi:hypothetical protein
VLEDYLNERPDNKRFTPIQTSKFLHVFAHGFPLLTFSTLESILHAPFQSGLVDVQQEFSTGTLFRFDCQTNLRFPCHCKKDRKNRRLSGFL